VVSYFSRDRFGYTAAMRSNYGVFGERENFDFDS
jgi:hypothetical protein